jgi:hypothetical protein
MAEGDSAGRVQVTLEGGISDIFFGLNGAE